MQPSTFVPCLRVGFAEITRQLPQIGLAHPNTFKPTLAHVCNAAVGRSDGPGGRHLRQLPRCGPLEAVFHQPLKRAQRTQGPAARNAGQVMVTRDALLPVPIHSTERRLQVDPLHHFAAMQQRHFRP